MEEVYSALNVLHEKQLKNYKSISTNKYIYVLENTYSAVHSNME